MCVLLSMTTVSSHDLDTCPAVGNATGLHGEFYFCPVIGRQFVVFQPDSGGNESGRGPALDSATEQAAKEASFVKLAVLLSRGPHCLGGLEYGLVYRITVSHACC